MVLKKKWQVSGDEMHRGVEEEEMVTNVINAVHGLIDGEKVRPRRQASDQCTLTARKCSLFYRYPAPNPQRFRTCACANTL